MKYCQVFKLLKTICLGVILFTVVGCASIPEGQIRSKKDPWEAMNRNVFAFNQSLDDYLLIPIARAYQFVLPETVRTGISNIFANVGDVYTALNNFLQGKPKSATDDLIRVFVNTTMGLGGIMDVASMAGVEKHAEDFGQTFAVWGFGEGPYMVLPLLGASSVRDTVGWVFDLETDILINLINDIPLRNSITGVRVVDQRVRFIGASELLDSAAIDRYSFIRDAYFQRRRYKIYDGNPPPQEDDDEILPVKVQPTLK
ncbi:MAG: VacJ family lipoprotein [Betaproteobacteria bacterium]